MFNVFVEMPSGARSRGYEREKREDAWAALERMRGQMTSWANFTADVVMVDETGRELYRETVRNP